MKTVISILIILFAIQTANGQTAKAHYEKAMDFIEHKQYDFAIYDLNKLTEMEPQNADGYYWRGICYTHLNSADKALIDFNKCIELRPGFGEAYLHRGRILYANEDLDRALSDFNKAFELAPENTETLKSRVLVLNDLGMYNDAIRDFQHLISITPNYPQYYVSISKLYLKAQNAEESIKSINKALEFLPNDPNLLYDRALIKLALNDRPGACIDLTAAEMFGYQDAVEDELMFCKEETPSDSTKTPKKVKPTAKEK